MLAAFFFVPWFTVLIVSGASLLAGAPFNMILRRWNPFLIKAPDLLHGRSHRSLAGLGNPVIAAHANRRRLVPPLPAHAEGTPAEAALIAVAATRRCTPLEERTS